MASKYAAELIETARAIGTRGKGILAADESTGTIGKRFAPISVENTRENRIAYREMLFRTEGLNANISGVIMFEETLFDDAADGTPLVDLLKAQGIISGIKIDQGVKPLLGTDGETRTQGLTNLGERCAKYYARGARFSKWRAVLNIRDGGKVAPSELGILENAHGLARMAAISQENGLVPIVEPEVMVGDGNTTLEQAAAITQKVQAATIKALHDHHVMLEGCILKPNMVRPGTESGIPFNAADIARATVRVLQSTIPPALPTINFLSGGMSEEEATVALDMMNRDDVAPGPKPWCISFSYGRGLQASVLKAWQGKPENIAAAQKQLLVLAKNNGDASKGCYDGKGGGSTDSLHIKNYSY